MSACVASAANTHSEGRGHAAVPLKVSQTLPSAAAMLSGGEPDSGFAAELAELVRQSSHRGRADDGGAPAQRREWHNSFMP
jgi:hypothetical protein